MQVLFGMAITAVLKRAFDQFDRFVDWSLRHDVFRRVDFWVRFSVIGFGAVVVLWLLFIGNIGPGAPTYNRCGFLNRPYATAADFDAAQRAARAISCPWPPNGDKHPAMNTTSSSPASRRLARP